MEQESEVEMKARHAGQDCEYRRWLDAFHGLGFRLHPGLPIVDNLIEFGRWWKANADRFERKS